jgi:hypothetical protein
MSMRVYPNPYEYRKPVSFSGPYAFIRRDEFDVIDELVFTRGENCLLVGGPKVGKTSLVGQLVHKRIVVPIPYCVGEGEQPGKFSLRSVRHQSSVNALMSFWEHIMFSLVDEVRQREEIDQEKAERLDSMGRIMLKKKGPIDNESVGRIGQRIAELDTRVTIVLDDFDDLVQDRSFTADFFEVLFEQMFILGVESKQMLRTIICSSVAAGRLYEMQENTLRGFFAAKVERASDSRKDEFRRLCDGFLADFGPLELGLFSINGIRELTNVAGWLPPGAWHEVYRESGGHPFVAQMFCYYAAKERRDRTHPIDWPEVRSFVEKDEEFKLFVEEICNACTEEERILIHVANGKPLPLSQRIQQIESRQLSFGGLPGSILVSAQRWEETQAILENLVSKPATKGMVFREAKPDEIEIGRPELVWVMREAVSEEQRAYYMVGARAIWRALWQRIPKTKRPSPTWHERFFRPVEWYYVIYLTLATYIAVWVILDMLGWDIGYARWAWPWMPLYSIIGWILNRRKR